MLPGQVSFLSQDFLEQAQLVEPMTFLNSEELVVGLKVGLEAVLIFVLTLLKAERLVSFQRVDLHLH